MMEKCYSCLGKGGKEYFDKKTATLKMKVCKGCKGTGQSSGGYLF